MIHRARRNQYELVWVPEPPSATGRTIPESTPRVARTDVEVWQPVDSLSDASGHRLAQRQSGMRRRVASVEYRRLPADAFRRQPALCGRAIRGRTGHRRPAGSTRHPWLGHGAGRRDRIRLSHHSRCTGERVARHSTGLFIPLGRFRCALRAAWCIGVAAVSSSDARGRCAI
jgi:hypothetical protein